MASDRISPPKVCSLLSSGRPIVFVDTRNPKAWAESDQKLPGAIRGLIAVLEGRALGRPEADSSAVTMEEARAK